MHILDSSQGKLTFTGCTWVLLVTDEHAPEHDRYHLAGFAERLPGQRDVPQGFILTSSCQDIGAGHPKKIVERCSRPY